MTGSSGHSGSLKGQRGHLSICCWHHPTQGLAPGPCEWWGCLPVSELTCSPPQIHMVYSKRSGKPRGYAFIEYEHERDMHCEYLRLRPPSGPLSSLLPRPLPAVWPTPTPPNLTSAVSLLLLPLFLIYLLFFIYVFF